MGYDEAIWVGLERNLFCFYFTLRCLVLIEHLLGFSGDSVYSLL